MCFLLILLTNVIYSQDVLSERYTTYLELENKIIEWDQMYGQNDDPYSFVNGEGVIFHHEIIGYTNVDNLPIWAIKLSFNANVDEDEPKVLILGQCHAEEIYGVEIAIELIEWLLNPLNSGGNQQSLLNIMSKSEIWVIPTHNPEGLNIVHGWYDDLNQWHQDESYRKNKYDANQNNVFDYFYGIGDDVDGVDLNRNYDFNWIFGDDFLEVDTGCSANPSYLSNYDYYRGPHPFSEPEIQAIKNFTLDNNFILSIAYHSSRSGCVSEKVISPWLWEGNKASPDLPVISRLGDEIASKTPSWDGQSNYYSANSTSRRGNAHDWLYANTGCIQYLIEVGTSDMQSDNIEFIEETIDNNMQGLLHLLKRAAGTNIQGGPDMHQITGIVTGSDGSIPSAEVKILELDGPMLKSRYTDSFGRYRRLLIEGTYTLQVRADGYENYVYQFVPSVSTVTEHDVVLNKLPEYNIDFDVLFPSYFNEPVSFIFENDFHSDTLIFNDLNEDHQLLIGPNSFSQGEHKLTILSENIFPEIIYFNVLNDSSINVDLKWKGVSFIEEFDTSDLWTESSTWTFSDGFLKTQNSEFYENGINEIISMHSNFDFGISTHGRGIFTLEVDLKKELEWENDYITFYLSCDNCSSDTLLTLTDQSWNTKRYYSSFESPQPKKINISIFSDSTLFYRGAELDRISLLFKPVDDCYKGDLNFDGSINVNDIILIINTIFETISLEGILFCAGDMNSNALINVNDIVLVVENILSN